MEILKEPITCIPCGHSYCIKCKDGYQNNKCHECDDEDTIEVMYRNKLLEEILGKFVYKKEILYELREKHTDIKF